MSDLRKAMFSLSKLQAPNQVTILALLIGLAFVYPLSIFILSQVRKLRSPLRKLRNFRRVGKWEKSSTVFERLQKCAQQCGDTFTLRGLLGDNILITFDPRALNHILTNSYMYPKPTAVQRNLAEIFGEGLLVTEGETHKRQRRVMNPSFSRGNIRDVTPIFFEKALELRDILQRVMGISESEGGVLDVFKWVSRATLDIIGLAGFDYSINSLSEEGNELAVAFTDIFKRVQDPTTSAIIFHVLRSILPVFRYLPVESNRVIMRSTRTVRRIGLELVGNKKATALRSLDGTRAEKDIDKSRIAGRDLLSSLVRANMAADVPPSQKLTDEEVSAQISTFLLAGHETTSSAVSWALYALSKNPDVQTKLRDEVVSVPSEAPSMDELDELPYLDMFVREVMRYYSPVSVTSRVAQRDDVIPVAVPYLDRDGVTRDIIRIQVGDQILIPIANVNRNTLYWGPDANEFNPERWRSLPSEINTLPGVWSHLLTFISGPRACIGYRFSLVEAKAILFTLLRALVFDVDDPATEILSKEAIVSRPFVKGKEDQGIQLPLRVSAVSKIQ